MKWDMGGAAAVSGLMHALAGRKAKVNAIGVIGLVEKWKKLGVPPPPSPHLFNFDGPTKKEVTEKLAREVWQEFKLQQKADLYAQDETEPNALLRRGDTMMTAELIRARVQESYEGLNAAGYAYAENLGAYPKLTA